MIRVTAEAGASRARVRVPSAGQAVAGDVLVPTVGDWVMQGEEGIASCVANMELAEQSTVGFIDVVDGGERIRITTYDEDGGVLELERIEASESEATYYADLTPLTGINMQMTLVFTSPTTLGGRMQGCPERGGQGYLLEARDFPSGSSGAAAGGAGPGLAADCAVDLAAIDGALRSDFTSPAGAVSGSDMAQLVDCFEPHFAAFIVSGLPDVSGVYFTGDGFTRSYGSDGGQSLASDSCAVAAADQVFYTDSTMGETQVWVGTQEQSSPLVGALRITEDGITHNYLPYFDGGFEVDVSTGPMPGDNPWSGWAVLEGTFYNANDFFPYAAERFDGDPAYAARFTLVCG